jgi:hypothetical protein
MAAELERLVLTLALVAGCTATDDESLGMLQLDADTQSIQETELDSFDAATLDAGLTMAPPMPAAGAIGGDRALRAPDARADASTDAADAGRDAQREAGRSLECIFEPWECP